MSGSLPSLRSRQVRRHFASQSLSEIDLKFRQVCKYGTKCYRQNPEHLAAEAHPADDDYLDCCRSAKVEPEFISVRKLFEWSDVDFSGRVGRNELLEVWQHIQRVGCDVKDLDDAVWAELDEDGNGYVNFSEFAEFTTAHKVSLPLGLDDLTFQHVHSNASGEVALRCGVYDCQCKQFTTKREKCRYGEACYQKSDQHLQRFCHPSDVDWDEAGGSRPRAPALDMCWCGHKKRLHASALTGAAVVPYPSYWHFRAGQESEFTHLIEVPDLKLQLQSLVDATYSDVTTRDRSRHNGGDWSVPTEFILTHTWRNENSKLWRKYMIRKQELRREQKILEEEGSAYKVYTDVKTTDEWTERSATLVDSEIDTLDPKINEWYLFHGTSYSAAKNICAHDFKMRLAGSATGTLYGKGSYLAESITKADEYSREEEGGYTVLLCRVLGGHVKYVDERTPDPEELTRDCTQGPYDCILGDRIKTSKTYREFIIFDNEHVYPEYLLRYKRGDLFKSPSHPENCK